MTVADIIFGILIAAPTIVSFITLSEVLTAKRLILESIEKQNRALAAIMESQIVIHKVIAPDNAKEERQ